MRPTRRRSAARRRRCRASSASRCSEVLTGPLAQRRARAPPFSIAVHREYNPEGKTSTNIVPGLLAIILVDDDGDDHRGRHRQGDRARHDGDADRHAGAAVRGDAGQDPALCVRRLCADASCSCSPPRLVFHVPFEGSWLAFFLGFNLFIVVNLALGFLISTAARNQMQAMQLSFFTILPSILLSGFMFPFAGMPGWAQFLGTGRAGDAFPARSSAR